MQFFKSVLAIRLLPSAWPTPNALPFTAAARNEATNSCLKWLFSNSGRSLSFRNEVLTGLQRPHLACSISEMSKRSASSLTYWVSLSFDLRDASPHFLPWKRKSVADYAKLNSRHGSQLTRWIAASGGTSHRVPSLRRRRQYQIDDFLNETKKSKELAKHGSFVCFLMAHGRKDPQGRNCIIDNGHAECRARSARSGARSQSSRPPSAPTWRGKPKIFFVQRSCRSSGSGTDPFEAELRKSGETGGE
uniref:CASPASE_P20 domain-containing protein n=1 Tax=Macrostomum lignano TaxID=282301 RepID=A0A1I8F920_9PLAT